VAHLRVVEQRKTKVVRRVKFVELHVGLAARDQFAAVHDRPLAIFPQRRDRNLTAITGERRDDDGRDFVTRDELGIVKRDLVRVQYVPPLFAGLASLLINSGLPSLRFMSV